MAKNKINFPQIGSVIYLRSTDDRKKYFYVYDSYDVYNHHMNGATVQVLIKWMTVTCYFKDDKHQNIIEVLSNFGIRYFYVNDFYFEIITC